MKTTLALLVLAAPLLARTPPPVPPHMQTGASIKAAPDPGKLKVKVKRLEDSLSGYASALMTVEVSNPTDLWCEPIEFFVPTKKNKAVKGLVVPRVEPPFAQRRGRAIPPHGKLTFVLGIAEKPKRLSKSKVKLLRASFFADGALEGAPIVVGKLGQATPEPDGMGGSTPFATVLLRNTSEHTVDAILRADFKFPLSGDALVRFRLAPLEERLCTIEGPEVRFMGWPDQRGSKLKSIELVDWSALVHEQPGQAEALLRAAFEARAKWPSPHRSLEADYTAKLEYYDFASNRRVKTTATGRFRTTGIDSTLFEPNSGGPIILGTAQFDSASLRLAQKPFDEWLGAGMLWIHTSDADTTVVGVLRSRDEPGITQYFWVQNGNLIGKANYPLFGDKTTFTLESLPGGSVVVEERTAPIQDPDTEYFSTKTFEYGLLGKTPVPIAMHSIRHFNPASHDEVVDVMLVNLRFKDQSEATPLKMLPGGELAGEVRAAWERAYRFPDRPLEITGHFRMTNAGNDLIWRGYELVEGRFHIQGLVGSTWESATIELEGTYTEEVALALEEAVRDRFGLYMSRDLTARPSFASQFMGARFEKQGSKILVEGCSVRELEIKRGQLVAHAEIRKLKPLRWKPSDDGELLSGSQSGAETITFQRESIDGIWLATRIKMTGVFEDWGPEAVELSDLRVERR